VVEWRGEEGKGDWGGSGGEGCAVAILRGCCRARALVVRFLALERVTAHHAIGDAVRFTRGGIAGVADLELCLNRCGRRIVLRSQIGRTSWREEGARPGADGASVAQRGG